MIVLRSFLLGAIGGFILGFLCIWLYPVFAGTQSNTLAGVWTALCGVSWSGVFIITAFVACISAWYSFWYGTDIGREIRFWDWIFNLWR